MAKKAPPAKRAVAPIANTPSPGLVHNRVPRTLRTAPALGKAGAAVGCLEPSRGRCWVPPGREDLKQGSNVWERRMVPVPCLEGEMRVSFRH